MDADTVEDFLKHQANIQHMREWLTRRSTSPSTMTHPMSGRLETSKRGGKSRENMRECRSRWTTSTSSIEGEGLRTLELMRRLPLGLACTRARHCLTSTLVTPRCIVNFALLFKIFP